jgi:NAD(P)-dependent dehydrogenase (short-subunit alcohol dehydrogenase family)
MSQPDPPVAIVTGASSGIGRATALALAAAGYRVFGTSRRPAGTEPVDGIEPLKLDVTSDASVSSAVAAVLDSAGRIDLLVNNAGVGVAGAAEESSIEQAHGLFDTNVYGTMRMTGAVLPHMRARGRGRIVNISSVLGFIPAPFMSLYSATKHAIEGYSESLDHELRSLGVRVIIVEPAFTQTSFDQNMTDADRPLPAYAAARVTAAAVVREAVTGGDADDPEVVARVVVTAAGARNPRTRYPAGKLANRLALARRWAPATAFDRAVRKQNHLT